MHYKSYVAKEVESVYRCYRDIITTRIDYTDVYEYLDELAEELAEAYLQENAAAFNELTNWLPGFARTSQADIFDQNFGLSDMRLAIARSHGFEDWDQVDEQGDLAFNEHFESAVDCIQSGDITGLKEVIESHPGLVKEKSPLGHSAFLLHYCATNGVETYHQKTPLNLPEMAAFLIEKGADKNVTAKSYGGAFTAAELAGTSGHPTAAGIMEKLLEVLK